MISKRYPLWLHIVAMFAIVSNFAFGVWTASGFNLLICGWLFGAYTMSNWRDYCDQEATK